MDKGLIFDIERFSTKDGPGIRTVVFFKGCNMSCYWCHNPEGIRGVPELRFEPDKCAGCGICFKICPMRAHKIDGERHIIDENRCTLCFACANACTYGSLTQVGKWMSVDEIYTEIEEDRAFYERSGGGVTLSGGEAMKQSDFAAKLLKRCHEGLVHTAMETNLSFPWADYKKLLPHTDLIMGDIKHMDDAAHRKGTGAGNITVLDNVKRLAEAGIPLIIRTPVIPGYNNDVANIRSTAEFLKDIPTLKYYELLSYNPLGNSKGILIKNPYKLPDIQVPEKAGMERLADAAMEYGIEVYIDGRKRTGSR